MTVLVIKLLSMVKADQILIKMFLSVSSIPFSRPCPAGYRIFQKKKNICKGRLLMSTPVFGQGHSLTFNLTSGGK